MQEEKKFRHELKYEISHGDYLAISSRLKAVMIPDRNAIDGKYMIKSIYFDNFADKALREKADGVRDREKFRIRWYNDDLSYICLEKKQKVNSLCLKIDEELSKDELMSILSGNIPLDEGRPLLSELYLKTKYQALRPRVAVSYTREPYVYRPGNVRVTFDSCIRSSLFSRNFLDAGSSIPATDEPSSMLMEVKYDEFLPDVISCLIQSDGIRVRSFSKYGTCRRFG